MHYGVKGMKWGKHLKARLEDFYKKKITGEAYLKPTGRYYKSYQDHKTSAESGYYLSSGWRKLANDSSYSYKKSALRKAREENQYGRKHEAAANRLLRNYQTKSLKGIVESSVKKGRKIYASLTKKNKTNIHPSGISSPKPKVIREQYITEKKIPEKQIREKQIREKRIREKRF